MMRIAFFALAFAVAGPALAADRTVGKQSKAEVAEPAQKDKLVCRREVPIGSLIASRKTCLTALQWQKQAEDAQAELDRMNPHISTEHGQ